MADAALRLTNSTQSATIDAALPYEATLMRTDGNSQTFAVSLDESAEVVISNKNPDWLYDSNDSLLFDSNSILLEADV